MTLLHNLIIYVIVGFVLVEKPAKSVPLGGVVYFLFHTDLGLAELIQY